MKKILLIEDDYIIRNNIKIALKELGYEVIDFDNGNDALLYSKHNQPDLIICDIIMPKMNGYEVIKELSKSELTATIPFIFLTGKSDMEDLRYGMELGADDYLLKPFKMAQLVKAIDVRLNKKEQLLNLQNYDKKAHNNKLANIINIDKNNMVNFNSIIYISASNQYSTAFLTNGKKIMTYKPMSNWELLLPNDIFFRVHRSTIINKNYISHITRYNDRFNIYLNNINEPFVLSRRQAVKLREVFSELKLKENKDA